MVDTTAPSAATAPARDAALRERAYVDWPAVFAGAVVAAAIAFLFTTFGAGIGLSLTDLIDGENAAVIAAIAVGLWVLWVAVSSLMAGGYVTGRLRRTAPGATPHEVEMRDGLHGVVMWGVGALIGAVLASSALATGARVGGEAAASVAEATSSVAAAAAGSASEAQLAYLADQLFRGDGEAAAVPSSLRDQVGRMIGEAGAAGEMAAGDAAYLNQVVAARTGLSEADAQARVSRLAAELQAAAEAAEAAADTARRVGILVTFLTAASLLVGAVGAWWAAGVGGRHRDEGTDFSRHFGWRR